MIIFDTINNRNSSEAFKLLAVGEDIEATDNKKNTPLIYAVLSNQPSVVNKLLELGADAKAKNYLNFTALHYAVMHMKTDESIITSLLCADIDIMAVDWMSCTILHTAAREGNIEAVKAILKFYPDIELIDAIDDNGKNAVDYAINALQNSQIIIKILLDNNAKVILHNMLEAAYIGDKEIIDILHQSNDNLLNMPDVYGRTCLHYAYLGQAFYETNDDTIPHHLYALGAHSMADSNNVFPDQFFHFKGST